ncbi:hypothetical protein [Castellaniella sp.]|uniref:hypothetical protein n=1 Tax=Castellaniella sp. TaxID=1955812 RepID=UPI002AFE14C7|nr:hypothetical protein [Castellaniella sp.]
MSQYPEHDKLKALNGKNQIVGNFLGWLFESNRLIAQWGEDDQLLPDMRCIEEIIADYFGIDRNELEAEKYQMIEAMRAAQQP